MAVGEPNPPVGWLMTLRSTVRRPYDRVSGYVTDIFDRPYRQAEALAALYRSIDPTQPLTGFGKWAISPDFALLLAEIVRERRPATIVELGTGLSTLVTSYVLSELGSGTIFAVDHEQRFLDESRQRCELHGVGTQVVWVHAPLVETTIGAKTSFWYDIRDGLPADIDLLVVDGPPGKDQRRARYPAIGLIEERLAADGVVLVDDARRRDERSMVRDWCRESRHQLRATFVPLIDGAFVVDAGGRSAWRS